MRHLLARVRYLIASFLHQNSDLHTKQFNHLCLLFWIFFSNIFLGTDRPLDRDELESRRPQIQSWEVNPEMVPRNR